MTRRLFCADFFERLDYIGSYALHVEDCIARFAQHGIGLADLFEEWRLNGIFMHTPNHPRSFVLFDILTQKLLVMGHLDSGDVADRRDSLRMTLPDALVRGRAWPVYPEIARSLSMAGGAYAWENGKTRTAYGLEDMIAGTYGVLEEKAHGETRQKLSSLVERECRFIQEYL